ncbi:hypothetical protein Btru_074408 [Bulinus truncatus]|nr:hypothetical protein Btru_074408 [Bulinus truncatus]
MRPTRQVKLITVHIDGFVNLRRHFEHLVDDVNIVISKTESWLEGNDDCGTFSQINHILDSEMSSILEKCLNIATEKEEIVELQDDLDVKRKSLSIVSGPTQKHVICDREDQIKEFNDQIISLKKTTEMNLEKLSHVTEKMSRKIKLLQQNEKDQDKYIQTISLNQSSADTKNESKFREIMQELHSASEFIQYQTESLSEQIKKSEKKNNEEIMKTALDDLKSQIETIFANQSSADTKSESKFSDIVQELHSASNFIQSQTDILSVRLNKLEKKNNDDITEIVKTASADLKSQVENVSVKLEENSQSFSLKIDDIEKKVNVQLEKKVNELLQMSDDLKRITESQSIKTKEIEVYIADEFKETINKSQSELANLQESIFNKLEEQEGIHMLKLNEFTRKLDTLEKSLANIPSTVEISQNEMINILSTKAKADIQDFDVKIKEMEKNTADILTKIATLNKEMKSVSSTIDMYDTVIHDNTKVMHIIKQEVFQRLLSTAQTNSSISTGIQDTDEKLSSEHEHIFCQYGDHETQLSEGGENDLFTCFESCEKNPDHDSFIPIEKFTIKRLPEGHRSKEVYEFVKNVADLTVRVDVKMISEHRAEFWPDTDRPYPFYNLKKQTSLRTGSGIIYSSLNGYEVGFGQKHRKNYTYCWCRKCQHSTTPSQNWWEFKVATAAQVVCDATEASHTSLLLFYDDEDSPSVSVDQVVIDYVNLAEDVCSLICVTCDKSLADRLKSLRERFNHVKQRAHDIYRQSRDFDKVNFIVSHPHGYFKQVSVGFWKQKCMLNNGRSQFIYTTKTCQGSAGAFVCFLGYDNFNYGMIHSGTLGSGLNISGAGLVA